MEAGLCAVVMSTARLCKNKAEANGRCYKHRDWCTSTVARTRALGDSLLGL